jgi:hypothetical protein
VQKKQLFFYLPLLVLVALALILFLPQILGIYVPTFSDLSFFDRTSLFAASAFAAFAAIEGYSSHDRSLFEIRRYQIEDSRNELEKAYGPLFSILNKAAARCDENAAFWLEREERKRIDDILSTYPFMLPPKINELWQDKIRDLGSKNAAFDPDRGECAVQEPYAMLRELVNEEYRRRLQSYHQLIAR